MLIRLLFLLFVLPLTLCPTLAHAQQASWGLTNTSNATLHFETLDPARGTWKGQTIHANQSVNYTMSPGVATGKFRIETAGRGFVEYQVLAGKKYTIGWDSNKDMWDMKFAPGYSANASPNRGNERYRGDDGDRDGGRQNERDNRRDHARGDWQDGDAGNGHGHERRRGDQRDAPYVPPAPQYTTYKLQNTSNDTVNFETLDFARGTWKKQTLYPNQSLDFTMSPGTTVGKIRIGTDGRGFVEYDMRLGWSYKILFDSRKGVWDVQTVRRAN